MTRYMIGAYSEHNDDGATLYWSNVEGWTEPEDADTFADDERASLALPVGGYWTTVERAYTHRSHRYSGAGCVNQWRADHDDDGCLRTFRERRSAPLHDHGVPVSVGAGVCECGQPI